ncbi:MAG: NnrS family protein [Methylophilaceae bacterium]
MRIQIKKAIPEDSKQLALFNLGFRPFFLGASIFAIVSMVIWMLVYLSTDVIIIEHITASQWHAHEMLYGYGLAVVAGFLLTAVKNWTGIPTLFGKPLAILFTLWCTARVLFLFGTAFLPWAASADLLFGLMLIVAITMPIIKAKQWSQLAVVVKVLLLFVGNLVFFLGYFGVLSNGMLYAINGAVLLFISLILMIGRRVIPFFIERGIKTKVQLKQYKWLDISILIVFLALFFNVIFIQMPYLSALFAWALFGLNGFRLCNWHTAGLWRVPLLWSLYLSAWFINAGFMMFALQSENSNLSILTLHLFTIGGVGLITLSMMSRVALGHTGRDIRKPSPWVSVAFISLIASVMFRVFLPLITSQFYTIWVLLAAIFWILSFTIYTIIYMPLLLKPRSDGAFG